MCLRSFLLNVMVGAQLPAVVCAFCRPVVLLVSLTVVDGVVDRDRRGEERLQARQTVRVAAVAEIDVNVVSPLSRATDSFVFVRAVTVAGADSFRSIAVKSLALAVRVT